MNQNCRYYYPVINEFISDVNDYGTPILDCELVGEICELSGKEELCDNCSEYRIRQTVKTKLSELPF